MNIIEVQDDPAIIHRHAPIGATFKGRISEFREDNTLLDVTGDQFLFVLQKADGTDVQVLEVGAGIEFVGDGIEWRFEYTDTATWIANAKWSYLIKWIRADNGDTIFVQAGTVIPKAYAEVD